MKRILVCASALCVGLAASADVIVMKSGAKFVGTVKHIEGGTIDFASEDVGDLKIKQDNVVTMTTDKPNPVEFNDKHVETGVVGRDEKGFTLDGDSLDMGKVKNVEYMFYLCSSLTAIYCNDDWSQLTNIENSDNMFINCFNLAGDFSTTFANHSWLTGITCARPDGGSYAPGFFSSKESVQKWPEGDLNHDGLVNAADLVRLADIIMNWK